MSGEDSLDVGPDAKHRATQDVVGPVMKTNHTRRGVTTLALPGGGWSNDIITNNPIIITLPATMRLNFVHKLSFHR